LVPQLIHNEEGYTVVEVLVALTLITIISTVVGSVLLFTSGQMSKWRISVNSTNDIHIATERVYQDFLQSKEFNVSDSSLMLNHPSRGLLIYSEISDQVMRNEIQLSDYSDSLLITDINITESSSRLNLTFVFGDQTETIPVITANRQPTLWEEIQRN
jgi:type II secretory pathway pseudopilin PulG